MAVFTTKCVGCHGGSNPAAGLDLSRSIDTIATYKEVIRSKPHASMLFKVVDSGSMPKGGTKLSPTEIASVRDWIMSLRPDPRPLFNARCINCHSGASPAAQLDLTGSLDDFAKLKQVVPGAGGATDCSLYKRVADGSMPKGGTKLTDGELGLVKDWLTGMHPNPKPIIQAKCIGCHSGGSPAGGMDLSMPLEDLKEVVKGKPAESALYLRVADGTMPKGHPPLTDSDQGQIWDWIASLKPAANQ